MLDKKPSNYTIIDVHEAFKDPFFLTTVTSQATCVDDAFMFTSVKE